MLHPCAYRAASLLLPSLQGRRWEELQPHFGPLWEMTLR